MRRRRPPLRPSPTKDWRALAREPLQHAFPLPVLTGDASTDPDASDNTDALAGDGLELRVRACPDGSRVATLVGALATTEPAVLVRLADRLRDAARALRAGEDRELRP